MSGGRGGGGGGNQGQEADPHPHPAISFYVETGDPGLYVCCFSLFPPPVPLLPWAGSSWARGEGCSGSPGFLPPSGSPQTSPSRVCYPWGFTESPQPCRRAETEAQGRG